MVETKNVEIKVVAVGDGAVGKTCMIICYTQDENDEDENDGFPEGYIPTVFDAYKGNMNYDGRDVTLHVWDTAGQEDLSRLRPLAYPNANCFLVCFSLVDRDSLKNACNTWRNEVITLGPSYCPKILVGLKSDLREVYLNNDDKKGSCISTEEGQKAKEEYNFQSYIECSAKTRVKLTQVFFKAVQTHFQLMEVKAKKANSVQNAPAPQFDKPVKEKKGGCSVL